VLSVRYLSVACGAIKHRDAMDTLEKHVQATESDLALQAARAAMLQKALKNALIDTATSPLALLTAFGVGSVLGANRKTREPPPPEPMHPDDRGPLKNLLSNVAPLLNWMAMVPAIISLWHEVQGRDQT
jgi:hypothetical protein